MELDIKLMWCKGLATFNFFQKLSVYAAVSLTPEDKTLKITQSEKQEQKTPIDHQGDGNPEWNSIMKFDLSPPNISSNLHKLALVFELRNQGQIFGYKEIGEVRVPVKDLVESVGVEVGRLVSYEVRGADGKHNGVLDFSYKVTTKEGLGNYRPDSEIKSGFENYDCCSREGSDYLPGTEKIQYPKMDFDASPNPIPIPIPIMPSNWASQNQPQFWAPPPPPAYFGPPPPTMPACCGEPPPLPLACCREAPPPIPECCREAPPPPLPRFLPPPPHQQPYAYQPPPYGDQNLGAYQGPPPGYYQQQPSGGGGGGGCEYPRW